LTVVAGMWLGHTEQGFNYHDPAQLQRQREDVRQTVLKYRNHPALLIWGLGNEMEGYASGDDPAIWNEVENLAKLVKSLDPNHPVMTITAEIGGNRVGALNKYCPDVDIQGVNSYAGAPSLVDRYLQAGGKKPIILTEFGPPGTWESGKTKWNAPYELRSDQKAGWYEKSYRATVLAHPEICLGAFAFLWANKVEATPTWFGMFLPDGSKLAAVDTMTALWSGRQPANPCPVIQNMSLDEGATLAAGSTLHAHLILKPSNSKLTSEWLLRADGQITNQNGAHEDQRQEFKEALTKSDLTSAELRLPTTPGPYRLYVTVRDAQGGAATANIPILVSPG
jgi:hypothetical protein